MVTTEYVATQLVHVLLSTDKREVCSSKPIRAGHKLLLRLDNTQSEQRYCDTRKWQ